MPVRRLIMTIALLVVSLSIGLLNVQAQDNLLRDGGFEDTSMKTVAYDDASGTRFSVNVSWEGWYTTTPREQPWQNQIPNGTGRNNVGAGFVRTGNRSQEISRGFSTFTAAIYQTVSVPAGSNLIGKAYYVMDLSLNDNPNARARIGIDPNGGNNPFDSDIVWSAWGGNRLASQGFAELTVNATATGPSVTFYLYATQTVPSQQNGIFWDDASLVIGGGGGAAAGQPTTGGSTPLPPATPVPQFAPSVARQGEQPDGSIVHIVQPSDTINSIAVAYGVTATYLIELNGIANPRFISVGQRILIRPAPEAARTEEVTPSENEGGSMDTETEGEGGARGESAVVTEEPTPEPTSTPAPTATPRPTSPPAPVAVADTDTELDLSSAFATLCVLIYEDANGDTVQQNTELPMAGGLVSLQRDGQEIDSFVTSDSPQPSCFTELEQGQYLVDASAPAGFTLLPSGRSRPNLPSGQQVNIVFAAVDSSTIDVAAPDAVTDQQDTVDVIPEVAVEDDNSNLLQYIGIAVFALAALTLLGGIGLGLMLRRR